MQASLWRTLQRENFTNWKDLLDFLKLEFESHVLPKSHFPLNLPRRLASKIQKGVWQDPVLLQFLPTTQELLKDPIFLTDPVKDKNARKTPKLLQKYHGRALLVCTSACAMNCRFCFRQHFDYEREDKTFVEELEALKEDPSITEIILSGGDPLSLSNEQLRSLIGRLDGIGHLKRLRFHTRFPIGIPERIDEEFLSILGSTRMQIYFVIHCNHVNELDEDILAALKKVQRLGASVLCQTVFLKGINDDLATLRKLFETLVNAGILPYYLHQLDRVQGAMHFESTLEKGREIIQELREWLPGYAVPAYVAEIPDLPSKTLL